MLAKRLLGKKTPQPSPLRIALLEILIIIIGILLSVAITEWFGNLKDGRRETAYLESLVKDLNDDLDNLRYDLDKRLEQLEACQKILELKIPEDTYRGAAIAVPFKTLSQTMRFKPSTATFRALESTDRMELINSDEIVRKLINLYTGTYDLVGQNNDDVTRYRNNFLLPFMVENLNFAAATQQEPVDKQVLNDAPAVLVEMTNHMIYNQISIGSTVTAYGYAIEEAEEALTLVKQELE